MSTIVAGSPFDRATRGYFCAPFSRATLGYWCYTSDVIDDLIKPPSGGTNTPPAAFPYREFFDQIDSIKEKETQKREDEEILLLIKIFLKCH